MKKLSVAVIGYGKLGKACAKVIQESDDLALAGAVLKEYNDAMPSAKAASRTKDEVRLAGHISELGLVEAALICVPAEEAPGVSHDILQRGISIVECASLEARAFKDYVDDLDRIARQHRAAAMAGAGWHPGVADELQDMFAMLIPKGRTTLSNRPGITLHHTAAVSHIDGIKDAMIAETHETMPRRYLYLELKTGAEFDTVRQTVLADPLFASGETQVFQVDSIAGMEDEGRGILIERRGTAGQSAHETLVFETHGNPANFAARIMIDAVRRMPRGLHGAMRYSLLR